MCRLLKFWDGINDIKIGVFSKGFQKHLFHLYGAFISTVFIAVMMWGEPFTVIVIYAFKTNLFVGTGFKLPLYFNISICIFKLSLHENN